MSSSARSSVISRRKEPGIPAIRPGDRGHVSTVACSRSSSSVAIRTRCSGRARRARAARLLPLLEDAGAVALAHAHIVGDLLHV